jgi:hypothetical protein
MEMKVHECISLGACSRRLFLLGLWSLDSLVIFVLFLGPLIKLWRILKCEAFVADFLEISN